MKERQRRVIGIVGLGIALIAIGVAAIFAGQGTDTAREAPSEAASPEPSSSIAPFAAEIPAGKQATLSFKLDSSTEQVLWRSGESSVYVRENRLYTSDAGETDRELYEWKAPAERDGQAWVNGEFLLLGTNEPASDSAREDPRGEWQTIRLGADPSYVGTDIQFFGPHEVLTVTAAEDPGILVFAVRNGGGFSEHVYDPQLKPEERWTRVAMADLVEAARALTMPGKSSVTGTFGGTKRFGLTDGSTLHAFKDGEGMLAYAPKPYARAVRFLDYEVVDAKLMAFVDQTLEVDPRTLVQLRSSSGKGADMMSYLDNYYFKLPVEPRLWEDGWQALSPGAYVRSKPDKLEAILFEKENSVADNAPRYRELPIPSGTRVDADGPRLKLDSNGRLQWLAWRDFVNVEPYDATTLLSDPLRDYIVREIPRPEIPPHAPGRIVEGSFEKSYAYNTNADIPDALRDALQEALPDGDYGSSKTFRLIESQWYVLVDRVLMTYKDGVISKIGELPIAISVEVGEGFGGHGALDFARVNGGWLVADTEASRVIKLNDELDIVAELAVPMPNKLTVEGERLRIGSIGRVGLTDLSLKSVEYRSQPYEPLGDARLVEQASYWPEERYEDPDTGLLWYVFNGFLHQLDVARKQYRSFFIGNKENVQGPVRILPYRGEVLVVLNRKLDRFARSGEWLGTIAYPRVRPDGIYDHSTQGESSIIVDEDADALYYVQGYRILRIDMGKGEAKTIFRQNQADIGHLVRHGDKLYALLRSNEEDRYTRVLQLKGDAGTADAAMYTELVDIDLQTFEVRRRMAEGFYDELEIGDKGFVLTSYTS
ncbi:hypothetical protein [Cohnella sp. GCM10027633]|uniref:hypothetical protein n=1 Tax=unclassified Cohnella TaxID=2636738 RepID=UPI0036404E80